MESKEEPTGPIHSLLAGNKVDNLCDSPLLEPKEEPFDDFQLIPTANETVSQFDAIMKEEVKEEPLDLVDSFPFVNEITDHHSMNENNCKKEETIDGEESLGAFDQPVCDYICPLSPVEPKTEVIEDRVIISVENPSCLKVFEYGQQFAFIEEKDYKFEELDKDEEIADNHFHATEGQLSIPLVESDGKPSRRAILKHKLSCSTEHYIEDDLPEKRILIKERPTESDVNKMKFWKFDDIELGCSSCEYRTWSVHDWENHIILKHNITPQQAGVILRCNCGNDSHSAHIFTCDIAKFTLVCGHTLQNRNVKRIVRTKKIKKENATELECPKCEFITNSAGVWYRHLSVKHSTTPKQEGLILRCACGNESRSDGHSYICNIAKFIVIRDVDATVPQFLTWAWPNARSAEPNGLKFCDDVEHEETTIDSNIKPKSASRYVTHLKIHHKTTQRENGVYRKSSCGIKFRSDNFHLNHNEKCDPH